MPTNRTLLNLETVRKVTDWEEFRWASYEGRDFAFKKDERGSEGVYRLFGSQQLPIKGFPDIGITSTMVGHVNTSVVTPVREKDRIERFLIETLKGINDGSRFLIWATGSDPEFFLTDGKDLVHPWKVLPAKDKRTGFFYDGFAGEITPSACGCHETHVAYMRYCFKAVFSQKATRNLGFLRKSHVEIPLETLRSILPKFSRLGCVASFNNYGTISLPLEGGEEITNRFAGGHLHFQWPLGSSFIKTVIRTLDATIGVASVSMAEKWDSPLRRQWYGLAGEYRLPKHGFEYRTLSNFWLANPVLTFLVLDLTRMAACAAPFGLRWLIDEPDEEICRIINQVDVEAARKYIKKYKEIFCFLIENCYRGWWTGPPSKVEQNTEYTFDCLLKPLQKFVDATNLRENWHVDSETNIGSRWHLHADRHAA